MGAMGETRNLLLVLRFCGTRYHGFQVQQNALSVCEVFQDAVERVFGARHDVKGCSRTDAGVHANMYCVSMRVDKPIPEDKVVLALNQYLPDDVAVCDCRRVANGFHARYAALGKEYLYRVHNARVRDPFSPGLVHRHWQGARLDETLLAREAQAFVGTRDFAAFQAAGSDVEDTVRTVSHFGVERRGDEVRFTVRGDGFLYKQVRIMVGSLLAVAGGRIAPGELPAILEARDRARAGKTAPACGLYLNRVFYPEEETGGPLAPPV